MSERKPTLTLELLEEWLNDNQISIRRDVISHAVKVDGIGAEFDRETLENDLHAHKRRRIPCCL